MEEIGIKQKVASNPGKLLFIKIHGVVTFVIVYCFIRSVHEKVQLPPSKLYITGTLLTILAVEGFF